MLRLFMLKPVMLQLENNGATTSSYTGTYTHLQLAAPEMLCPSSILHIYKKKTSYPMR